MDRKQGFRQKYSDSKYFLGALLYFILGIIAVRANSITDELGSLEFRLQSERNGRTSSGFPVELGSFYYPEGNVEREDSEIQENSKTKRGVIIGNKYRWPKATLVFSFDRKFPEKSRSKVALAMKMISKHTCIKFRKKNSKDVNYVLIRAIDDTCRSYIGRRGGMQTMNLDSSCGVGTTAHELMHALGFRHEQSRSDRDKYVTILKNNILKSEKDNFDKYGPSQVSNGGISYDYSSIMHYGTDTFGKKDKKGRTLTTIKVLKKGVEIGQRKDLSKKDILRINKVYCS